MSELWGFASGLQQAQQQNNQNQLTQLQLAEGRQKMGEESIKIEQEGVALQNARITLANQQKMQALLQQAANGGPKAPMTGDAAGAASAVANKTASQLEQMSEFAMQSGMPTQAADYAKKASDIRKNAATISKEVNQQNIKDLSLVANLMDGVHDQQSWNAANAIFMAETGHESKVAHLPYSPELVQKIKSGAVSAKDKALTEAAKARASADLARGTEARARLPLIKAQTEAVQDRDTLLKKAGATGSIPKPQNVKALTDLATKDFGGAGDAQGEAELRVAARPWAEKMEGYMKDEGLTQSQAAAKTYREAKQAGAFAGMRPMPLTPGSSPSKSLALPMDGKKLDKSKLQQNQWYDVQGQPMVLLGDKFYSKADLGHSGGDDEDEDETED